MSRITQAGGLRAGDPTLISMNTTAMEQSSSGEANTLSYKKHCEVEIQLTLHIRCHKNNVLVSRG